MLKGFRHSSGCSDHDSFGTVRDGTIRRDASHGNGVARRGLGNSCGISFQCSVFSVQKQSDWLWTFCTLLMAWVGHEKREKPQKERVATDSEVRRTERLKANR